MTEDHSAMNQKTRLDISPLSSWFNTAVPQPDQNDVHSQIAEQLNEFTKMLGLIADAAESFSAREELRFSLEVLSFIQTKIRPPATGIRIGLGDLDRIQTLDSLCRQISAAVGTAHMLNLDIGGALEEFSAANHSRFDGAGQPRFNENGDFIENPDRTHPNFIPYI